MDFFVSASFISLAVIAVYYIIYNHREKHQNPSPSVGVNQLFQDQMSELSKQSLQNRLSSEQQDDMETPLSADFYQRLGVSRTATSEQIRSSFLRLVKKYHPDKTQNDNRDKFLSISEAYYVLIDPDKRAAYDRGNLSNGFENINEHDDFTNWFKQETGIDIVQIMDVTVELLKRKGQSIKTSRIESITCVIPQMIIDAEKIGFVKRMALKKGERYFLIGKPILISDKRPATFRNISQEEIIASIPKSGTVNLMDQGIFDPSLYVILEQKGDIYHDINFFAPALVEVELKNDLDVKDTPIYWTKAYARSDASRVDRDIFPHCMDRTTDFKYRSFFTDMRNLTLISAKLNPITIIGTHPYTPISFIEDRSSASFAPSL